MAFVKLIFLASSLKKLKTELEEEKLDVIAISKHQKPKRRFRHIGVDIRIFFRKILRNILNCFCCHKFCYKLQHYGSFENFILKSLIGYLGGFILTYTFFLFFVFQLNFKITTATIVCSILGIILMIGLAFSTKVRCIVLLTLPQFFSEKGRQALIAYAFILAVSGPAKNTLNNMGIMSESLACGQEQLKQAVRQIIEVIKKPFLAIKDAIKKVVKTVKEIIKKIKEILIKIKRIIMAIVRVIKAAFQFLARIINICNKELGTPFERCIRVFDNAIIDCNAKLGPMFSWLCSITYIIKTVCYIVKPFDFVCMIIDFISNSVIGVVIRKVKTFVRHIRTMFYVRIKFSHSFQFHTNSSKSIAEISEAIVKEIKDRTQTVQEIFKFLTSAASLFFIFIIVKVTYYRYKYLTSERFDNKYITKHFFEIDLRRAKLEKETVLPLNHREEQIYIKMKSAKLVKSEKKALSKSISTLATATMKILIMMGTDYSLYWMLNLIKYYGKFQSKVQAPNLPTAHISGEGFLANLLKSIVKAFQPMGIELEIDTVPCLPTPIPPDYDRYVQLATLLLLCWILAVLEPYGLRLRNTVMSYYHPLRAKQRSIWLYNHLMRSRNSFLKFARRQLKRMLFGAKGIEKVTCKEYLAANFRIFALCFEKPQTVCLVCGTVFRETDTKKPVRCQKPGCPGVYCEQCFADLNNLCTVCMSPIDYGDLSDIDEERDSSEEEVKIEKKKLKIKTAKVKKEEADKLKHKTPKSPPKRWWAQTKKAEKSTDPLQPLILDKKYDDSEMLELLEEDSDIDVPSDLLGKTTKELKVPKSKITQPPKKWFWSKQKKAGKAADLLPGIPEESPKDTQISTEDSDYALSDEEPKMVAPDSDYYSSDSSTDYSYSYQDDKTKYESTPSTHTPFRDVEKQEIPDYASMDSYRDEPDIEPLKKVKGTSISGTVLEKSKPEKHVDFIGVPSSSEEKVKLKPISKRKQRKKVEGTGKSSYQTDIESEDDFKEDTPFISAISGEKAPKTEQTRSNISIDAVDLTTEKKASTEIDSVEARLKEMDLSQRSKLPFMDPALCLCSESDDDIQDIESKLADSSLFSVPIQSTTGINTNAIDVGNFHDGIEKLKEELADVPTIPNICVCKKSSRRISNVHYEEITESPRSSSSSHNLSSSSFISSLSDYNSEKHLIHPKKKNTTKTGPIINYVQMDYNTFPVRREMELKQRNKIRQYYKAVKNIPVKKIRNLSTPNKIRTMVERIILKRRKNPGELPLYNTDSIELRHYRTIPEDIPVPECQCQEYYPTKGSPIRKKKKRFRGGGKFTPQTSYCGIFNKKFSEIVQLQELEETEPLLNQCNADEVLTKYHFDFEDLFPTRDLGFQMTEQIPPIVEDSGVQKSLEAEETNKETTQEPLLRETIPLETENASDYSEPLDSRFVSSSSTLSEGLCLSLLGKSCTNRKQKALHTIQENPDNIGIFFGKQPSQPSQPSQPEETKLSLKNKSRPENSEAKNNRQTEIPKRSSLDISDNTRRRSSDPPELEKNKSQSQKTTGENSGISEELGEDSNNISQPFQPVTTTNEQTGLDNNKKQTSENIETDSKEISQQTFNPSILKQTLQPNTMHQSYPSFRPSSTSSPTSRRTVCKGRDDPCIELEESQRYRVPSERQKIVLTSDKILQTSENNLLRPPCLCTTDTTDYISTTPQIDSLETPYESTYGPHPETSSTMCYYCKCNSPLPAARENYCSKKLNRYRSKKSIRSSRSSSPPPPCVRKVKKEVPYSPCRCQAYGDTRRPVRPLQRKNLTRQRPQREDCVCDGECRCYQKPRPKPTPLPPPRQCRQNQYHVSSSEDEEEQEGEGEEEVEVEDEEAYEDEDYAEIEDRYYSDRSPLRSDLPYQNNEDYLDLVQELEETLQNRSRNRVHRAMREFEHRSRYNKPLEKPIINYDETSESEEPIIQKIYFLTDKKKKKSYAACKRSPREETYSKPRRPSGSPRRRSMSPPRLRKNTRRDKTHWQMDETSGEWYKVDANQRPRRRRSRTPSPQKGFQRYGCSCGNPNCR